MTGYVIRRVLWGIALLVIVCALTFVLFRVLPTGNPAVLRAGRDPQPHLIKEIERVLGLDKSLPIQFWDYIKGVFLHFNFGYSYYTQQSVTKPDQGTPAGRRSRWRSGASVICGGRRPLGGHHLGAASRARCSTAPRWAAALVFDLGARILARPDRAAAVRRGHRQVQDLPRRGQLRADHPGPVEMVHLADHAVVRARGRQRGGVRAADARQPDRDDG